MNFTPEQLTGLNAAYTRQTQSSPDYTPIDKQNLDYATARGFSPTPPGDNLDVTVPSTDIGNTKPAENISPGPLEESPGTLKASSLSNFYNNQLDLMKPQYEAAQGNLSSITSQLGGLANAPGLGQQYQTQYTEKAAPLEAQLADLYKQANSIKDATRNIENDVRAQLGGRAAESVIKAEVARRSEPLNLQLQALSDQYGAISSQFTNVTKGLESQLGFTQSDITNRLNILGTQQTLAQNTVTAFESLIEKGTAATEAEKTNAQTLLFKFFENDPSFVSKLDDAELQQLQQGIMPMSALSKISSKASEPVTVSSGSSLVDPVTGKVIYQGQEESGLTPSQRMNAAINLMAVDPYLQDINQALARVDAAAGGGYGNGFGGNYGGGSTGGGTIPGFQGVNVDTGKKMGEMTTEELLTLQQAMQAREGYFPGSAAYDNNNPGNIKWGDFAASVGGVDSGRKATDGGSFAKFSTYEDGVMAQLQLLQSPNYANLGLDQAMRRWSGGGYGADVLSSFPGASESPDIKNTVDLGLGGPGLTIDQQGQDATPKPLISKTEEEILLAPPDKLRRKSTEYFDDVTKQSSAFNGEQVVKDFQSIAQNYNKILSTSPTAAGDMSLVFAYMKMLDPGSVVREGEYATAKNTAGVPEQVLNAYNKAKDGEFLSQNQRDNFKKEAYSLLESQKPAYIDKVSFYADRARAAGLDPRDVIPFTTIMPPSDDEKESVDITSLNFNI